MARPIARFAIDPQQERALRHAAKAPSTPQRVAQRCRVLWRRSEGLSQAEAGRREGLARNKVGPWERRFAAEGLAGLVDQKGRGRQSTLAVEKRARVLTEVTRPPKGRTRWTVRGMARHAGVSVGTVHGLWRANDRKPHRTRTHDYLRHGTVTLFAALSYVSGKVFGLTAARHTHKEWLTFLKVLEREPPPELDLHLILDNYATHKHPVVRAWLAKHPRFHLHFTPTSSSWLNLVERFFADLTAQVVREGSFQSVKELTEAIESYLAERQLTPKPYRWRAKGADILAKIQRARTAQTLCHGIS